MPIGPLRFLGSKHVEIATIRFSSALTFATTAMTVIIYATDWKPALQFLPFYNGKFKEEK